MLDSLSDNRGIPGRPKFSVGQRVRFSVYNEETDEREYMYGEVYIVDAYGTFMNPGPPSYDIYVVNSKYPEGCLYKHIPESHVDIGLFG